MKRKILIVEDESSIQKVLLASLTKLGYDVVQLESAVGALNAVKKAKPDLILLDIILPGGENGMDLLVKLKENNETQDIPVLVFTNLDSEEKTSYELGAIDYIVKANVPLEAVLQKIDRYLK